MFFLILLFFVVIIQAHPSFDTHVFEASGTKDSCLPSKHFVIVITSYNNQQWYLKNIMSACGQEYDNFEIIFTDDCSPDKTGDLVEEFLENNPPRCKITLIKNHTRCGAFQNIYRSISRCKPNDIVVSLDGDDWLANNQVLSHLNSVYANKNVWMTHGQFLMYPGNTVCDWAQKMPPTVVKNNAYRSYRNIPTHLRTFYVWLFRTIKLEDLLHEGSFYPVTWDMAFMLPMMELSGGNHAFIDKILYIYNTGNPLNDYKTNRALQRTLELKIRAKKSYESLKKPSIIRDNIASAPTMVLVTSHDNPAELEAFLQSLQKYVHPAVTNVYVVWRASSDECAVHYQVCSKLFSSINFIQHDTNFYRQLLYYLRAHKGYILISNAHLPFTQPVDLNRCTAALENTQATGLYFIHPATHHDFTHIDVDGHIQAWQFLYTPDAWKKHNPFVAILYENRQAMNTLINNTINRAFDNNSTEQVGLFLES